MEKELKTLEFVTCIFGHVNICHFKLMENQNIVGGLPKFEAKEVTPKVCETCQIRNQTRCLFSIQVIHVNSRSL
jgi:hypothetical protein